MRDSHLVEWTVVVEKVSVCGYPDRVAGNGRFKEERMLELNLEGKVALVTGGSEGIGKGVAWKLAEEGCSVAICARRDDVLQAAAQEIRDATDGAVLAVPADVTKAEDIDRFVSTAIETYGGVDILVNNAGRSAGFPFEDATDEIWLEDFDLKFWAAVRGSRSALPSMKERGGGSIINVTHPGGKAPGGGSVPTSISRAAGIAFTKALSHDCASYGIRVNTVCLTNIKTAQGVRAWEGSGSDLSYDAWCEEQGKDIPLGRLGEASEVGDLVAFLVSERAGFITGASVNIDGGTSHVV